MVLDWVPVWMPILLFGAFMQIRMTYLRRKYIADQTYSLLEVRLPKEIFKSPAAMEIVIASMNQTSSGSIFDVYLKGRVRPWFSLELVSIGGQVHFFIWTPQKFKDLIETQIYSQFPGVEVHEVEDYSLAVEHNPETTSMAGSQLKLTKVDPYPIKTYIDYGLDKDPKEEFKIDPITPVIEYLGSLKSGEQAWIQILIQAHKEETWKEGRIFKKKDWKDAAKKEIEEIIKKSYVKPEEGKSPTFNNLTDIQKDTIKAIERSLTKPAFECMIRTLYLAKKEAFSSVSQAGLGGSFRQFGSNNLNGFKPGWGTGYDFPWQDFRGKKKAKNERQVLEAYKRRSFFHPPFKNFHGKPFILTTEELATLFHFPGGVAQTPTFSRLVSKKAEPPANLPI